MAERRLPVGLAFRRLAIIDLSDAAMQPMANEDGSIRIVFNGEIYNHAEIRAGARSRSAATSGGRTTRTPRSSCMPSSSGASTASTASAACSDSPSGTARRRDLWLVRDRIGIKPLYYSVHHGRLTFASEIKALLPGSRNRPRAVNEDSLFHYLSFLTTPAPGDAVRRHQEAARRNVAASVAPTDDRRSSDGGTSGITRRRSTGVSDEEIAERVLDELRTSVRLRKVSDVPVGRVPVGRHRLEHERGPVLRGRERPGQDVLDRLRGRIRELPERAPLRATNGREVGADHHELLLTPGRPARLPAPRWSSLQDEPIADPVCVPVYYVSKLARDNGVIVCSGGRGRGRAVLRLSVLADDSLSLQRCERPAGVRESVSGWRSAVLRLARPRQGARGTSGCAAARGAADVLGWRGGLYPDARSERLLSPATAQHSRGDSWEALAADPRSGSRPRHGSRRTSTG